MARRPEVPPDAVDRTRRRLIDRLRSSEHPVVVVSGPAGAGKTALVEAWAGAERGIRFLRISRHQNSARLLLDAVLAAAGAAPGPIDPTDVRSWVDRVARSLAAASFTPERPCRLVLDGTDSITDPDGQLLLRDLVENRPPALRLVVTTRHRSPGWISRGRACGVAMAITAEDLRLRPAAVEQLLGEDVPELGGWALGIGLVASVGRAEADEAIHDYLRSEVVSRVTTEVRHLLYAVSIAGEFGPALAIALTGNPDAGRLLAEFADATQLATVTSGPVFTLHPVLARCLAHDLAAQQWEAYVAVRRRHADWLVTQGQLDRSTRLYVDLGAVECGCATLLTHWQRTVLSGHADVVRHALDVLPAARLAGDPRLCMVMAMVHLASGDRFRWQRWVDMAEAHADVEMEPGMSVGVAAEVARRFVQALTSGTARGEPLDHPLQGLWSALSAVSSGICLVWGGEPATAATCLRRAEVAARVSGDQLALVHALAGLALAAAFAGDSHAVLLADEAIAIADRLSPRCRWVVANAYLALATVHHSSGSPRATRDAANSVLTALPDTLHHLEQRTRAHALELLATLEPTTVRGGPPQASELSTRERRVLHALRGPLTLREIADELYVSHNTVKSQVSSIFRKLGVHDRAGAVAAARSRSAVPR